MVTRSTEVKFKKKLREISCFVAIEHTSWRNADEKGKYNLLAIAFNTGLLACGEEIITKNDRTLLMQSAESARSALASGAPSLSALPQASPVLMQKNVRWRSYKTDDTHVFYREAWADSLRVVLHWGIVGQRGETKEYTAGRNSEVAELSGKLAKESQVLGFRIYEQDDYKNLTARCTSTEGAVAVTDRNGIEDSFNEILGWTGLGWCDGGESDETGWTLICFVVDCSQARQVIESQLRDRLQKYSVTIHCGSESYSVPIRCSSQARRSV